MHVIVPFASALSQGGRAALRDLRVPHLDALLAALRAEPVDLADEWTLSPPHERALARALGLSVADGLVPLAALQAAQLGLDSAPRAWGRVTPAHWQVGTDQVGMTDPAELQLDVPESRALLDAVRPLFEGEGFELHFAHPTCWLATHPLLAGLPGASLDRVIGRSVDAWLTAEAQARFVRRLQNEVQMLLHGHAVNAAREAQGLPPVNSFWLSGCGATRGAAWPTDVHVDETLRAAALAEDWAAWLAAFAAFDAGPARELHARLQRGQPVTLTLAGERGAAAFTSQARSLVARVAARWRKVDARVVLEAL
jgi:hypothetical protein